MSSNQENKNKTNFKKNKTQTQIVLHKKNLDNGDLSEFLKQEIKKNEPLQRSSENFNTADLTNKKENFNLEKTSKTEKSKKIPTFAEKKEKEKSEFLTSVKSIKKTQEQQETKLKQTQFTSENKQINFLINQRLPKTILEIEENEQLVKLLLKNPDQMTPEEKIYISGFTNDEFKRFIQFLKIKDKELKWRGNDWGSGHYIEHYINIYRKSGITEEKNFLSLKTILKQNYKNSQTVINNKKEFWDSSNELEGNKTTDQNISENKEVFSKADKNLEKAVNKAKILSQNMAFEQTAKQVFKELENFKNTLLSHKNEVNYKKIETQNNIIFKDLETKSKFMEDDLAKMKNIKKDLNKKNEIEEMIEKYKNDIKFSSEKISDLIEDSIIPNKIKAYCKRMNITPIDLIKKLDRDSFIDFEVDLENLQESFYRFKIIDIKESEEFCKMLRLYYGKKIKVDYLIKILEVETGDLNYYNQILNSDKNEAHYESEDEDDYDYFNHKNGASLKDTRNDKDKAWTSSTKRRKDSDITINRVLGIRNYPAFEYLMQKKSAIYIQKTFRGYISRKKYRYYSIHLTIMAKRITKALKYYVNRIKTLKNESSAKITYLLRRNYIHKNKSKQLHFFTDKLFGKLTELPFSMKNRLQKIKIIQRTYRRYKEKLMKKFFDKNSTKMDINMLKTKTCFTCMLNRVTHLCRDCDDNHYCELCFLKFHSRGTKRNHSYLKISTLMEDMKRKKEQNNLQSGSYNEIAVIKNYLEQNNFNLYELLKLWDFNKNNTIMYRHFKDALMVRGIKFDPYIRDLLINLAMKYIIEDKTKQKEILDNLLVNYEALCLEFV